MMQGEPLNSPQRSLPLKQQRAVRALHTLLSWLEETLLPKIYGRSDAYHEVSARMKRSLAEPPSYEVVISWRALLYHAIAMEPEVRRAVCRFGDAAEQRWALDFCERCVPFTSPRFLAENAQAPDAALVLSQLISIAFEGEPLAHLEPPPPLAPPERAEGAERAGGPGGPGPGDEGASHLDVAM